MQSEMFSMGRSVSLSFINGVLLQISGILSDLHRVEQESQLGNANRWSVILKWATPTLFSVYFRPFQT